MTVLQDCASLPSHDSNAAMQKRDTPRDIDGVDATAGAETGNRTEDLAD
jgi:hypothetical protein